MSHADVMYRDWTGTGVFFRGATYRGRATLGQGWYRSGW